MLELPHILLPLLGHFRRVQALLRQQAVVGAVEVHPHCEDLAHILLAAYGVFAEEGEGAVLDEVAGEDGFCE